MESNQYKIVSKEMHGVSITGLVIENSDGNKKNISVSDAIKLTRSEKISNASAIFNTVISDYNISIEGGIKDLPLNDRSKGLKLTLLGRLVSIENKCVGYKAQDDKGKVYKLSTNKIWELAEQGSIVGIKAKICSKGKILESTEECNLGSLPILTTS